MKFVEEWRSARPRPHFGWRRFQSALLSFAVVGAIANAAPASAQVQETADFSAERLRPALDRNGVLDVESGQARRHLEYDIALWSGYASDPLVLYIGHDTGDTRSSLIQHRVGANLVAALSLFDWLELGVDLPLILWQARDTAAIDSAIADVGELTTFGLGDLRLVPKLQLLNSKDRFIDLALLAHVTLPTQTAPTAYFGDTSATVTPEVALSKPIGDFRLAANLGVTFRKPSTFADLDVGTTLGYRLGAAFKLDALAHVPVELALSLNGSTSATTTFEFINQNPLEAMGGVTWDLFHTPLQIFAYGGAGILAGFGTPTFRTGAGLRWSPHAEDRDDDGIFDDKDACPDAPEDKDGFMDSDGCADPDNDGDRILDAADKCPSEAEDDDAFQDDDGCPDPDNDQDGILDTADACKNDPEDKNGVDDGDGCPDAGTDADKDGIAGTADACPLDAEDKDGFEDDDGCPDTDNDKDGVLDAADKCPLEAEDKDGVEDEDGCPDAASSKVSLTASKIEILEKVYFDSAKSTIQARSNELLTQVANVLKQNPQLTKVRVEGHTDSIGEHAFNQSLSDARAKAVREFLVAQGVEAARLEAKGFGEERPLQPNNSAAGREANRRVEFVIVESDGKAVTPTSKVDDAH